MVSPLPVSCPPNFTVGVRGSELEPWHVAVPASSMAEGAEARRVDLLGVREAISSLTKPRI